MRQQPIFDPRLIPIDRTYEHLPAVGPTVMLAEALRLRFMAPPVWEPEVREELWRNDRLPVQAAVLVPIVLHDAASPCLLLTQRTAHLSSHSGQIAFPGGKVDAHDDSVCAAALREAEEEVGLKPEFVQVLGTLPVYMTSTAFAVTPVVALVHPGFKLRRNEHEVADIFEVPLDFLMNPANHRSHSIVWEGQQRAWFSMCYADALAERFIWGATAGMVRNFYRFLSAS